jgi:hypothetical protein
MTNRILARTHDRHAPGRARASHESALKRRDQTGSDERRLSAAGRADDREQTCRAQTSEQIVDFQFAAEEEVIFVGLERAQAREWIKQRSPPSIA